nr:DUF3927 family protein [Escherichia coli]
MAAILLFLVVAVDFTGRLMSVLADGVLGAMAMVVPRPFARTAEELHTIGIRGCR